MTEPVGEDREPARRTMTIRLFWEKGLMRFLVRLFVLVLFLTPLRAAQNSGGGKSLSKTEKAGEKLFLQRCSLCHLGYAYSYVTYGPPLYNELIAEVGEKAAREK